MENIDDNDNDNDDNEHLVLSTNLKNELVNNSNSESKQFQKKAKIKKTYNNIYLNNFNNKFFKNKDNRIMSSLEKAEAAYNLIKAQIDELLSKPETEEEEEISEQNTDMLEYFNQLNKIVSYLSDNSKIPIKIKQNKKQEKIVDPSINNEKILNIYKKENEKLKERINKYKDPEYRIKLETNKTKSEQRIKELEEKNKNLEKEQKLAEIQLEKISKGKTNENKLKMILMDFNNKQREYNKLLQRVEKEKREKNENEAKIKELNEWRRT